MDRSSDPAHVRVGICVGTAEDGSSAAKLVNTLYEVLAHILNLVRLAVIVLPVLVQCFFLHSVNFGVWLLRLGLLYALIGGACFVLVPEQLYNGLGLSSLRWVFERFHPKLNLDLASGGSSLLAQALEQSPGHLQVIRELHGKRARLRWHGTGRFLCLSSDGWALTGEEALATEVLLQQLFAKEKKVADTYHLRVSAEHGGSWHQAWLCFKPVDCLSFGGWLGASQDPGRACPYKLVKDSTCPKGTFKLLCASTVIPPPTQRSVTGFYVAEKLFRGSPFVGHGPDRDAALLELVLAA